MFNIKPLTEAEKQAYDKQNENIKKIANVTIKVRKSGELLPGIRVLTGYSGRKVWRTVSKIRQRSETCYSVFFEDGWNMMSGSEVKYLTK